MAWWKRKRDYKRELLELRQQVSQNQLTMRQVASMGNIFGVHSALVRGSDVYDNLFPFVNAIAQHASVVEPFAVDKTTGERLASQPAALRALHAPNDSFSRMEFINYLVTCLLVNQWTDILVWSPAGEPGVVGDNGGIGGYTFLPGASRSTRGNGELVWQVEIPGLGWQTFTRDSVLCLSYGRHPSDFTVPVAPGLTAAKWANVDDLLADFERGYFRNNAVPAGMLEIAANSLDGFLQTKQELEKHFRGAGKNNGVVYNFRPLDEFTADYAGPSKLTWVPFTGANNDVDLASVSDVVSERLANALAVPDIVRGIDHGQTYANAQQAQRTFVESTLRPFLLRMWDKFGFEVDRVCGGVDWRVGFDLVLPAQTDVEHVQAQTNDLQLGSLLALVDRGASVEDACRALGLGDEWQALVIASSVEKDSGGSSEAAGGEAGGGGEENMGRVWFSREQPETILEAYGYLLDDVCQVVEDGETVDVLDFAIGFAAGVTVALLLTLQVEAGVNALNGLATRVPVGGEELFDSLYEQVDDWYASRRASLQSEVEELVVNSLQSFLAAGGGDAGVLRSMVGWWARRFVGTLEHRAESQGVAGAGELFGLAFPEAGLQCKWVARMDENTCARCVELNGTTWDTAVSHDSPPAHPNCRCNIVFV